MRHLIASLRLLAWFTLLCGGAYTLAVTAAARALFPAQADGSLVRRGGLLLGSSLIGQGFSSPRYFWSRPSAVNYDPQASGGSNLGPTSAALLKAVQARREALLKADPGAGEPPQDLLFTSGSGLDPDISPEAALYQVDRVAAARGWDGVHREALKNLVLESVQTPLWGVLGQARVNVLNLNLAVDAMR